MRLIGKNRFAYGYYHHIVSGCDNTGTGDALMSLFAIRNNFDIILKIFINLLVTYACQFVLDAKSAVC